MQTKKLYYDDFYLSEFKARLVSCHKVNNHYEVILDQSAFFPTGGGVNADRGSLNDCEVINVVYKNQQIVHLLTQPIKNEMVIGKVDISNRYANIQVHQAQHIISALFDQIYGIKTHSLYATEYTCELFLESNSINENMIEQINNKANEIVNQAFAIETIIEENGYRIINVKGLDDMTPCGCLTLTNTKEIERIQIIFTRIENKLTRVTLSAGKSLTKLVRLQFEELAMLKEIIKPEASNLIDVIISLKEELAKYKQDAATKQNLKYEDMINNLVNENNEWLKYEGNSKDIKQLLTILKEDPRDLKAIFQTKKDNFYQYTIFISPNSSFNLNELFLKLKNEHQFIGGRHENIINGKSPINLNEIL